MQNRIIDPVVELRRSYANLVSCGHNNAHLYGYSFFKLACEQLIESKKKEVAALISGLAIALSNDEKLKKEFFGT